MRLLGEKAEDVLQRSQQRSLSLEYFDEISHNLLKLMDVRQP